MNVFFHSVFSTEFDFEDKNYPRWLTKKLLHSSGFAFSSNWSKWPLLGMFSHNNIAIQLWNSDKGNFLPFLGFQFFSSKLVQTRPNLFTFEPKIKKYIWVFFLLNFSHWIWFSSQKWSKVINKKVASLPWICLFIFFVKLSLFYY